jgi:hypothetical protein
MLGRRSWLPNRAIPRISLCEALSRSGGAVPAAREVRARVVAQAGPGRAMAEREDLGPARELAEPGRERVALVAPVPVLGVAVQT